MSLISLLDNVSATCPDILISVKNERKERTSEMKSILSMRLSIEFWCWVSAFVCLLLVCAFAWSSDDAYMTIRTVNNFVDGFGARYNTDERVMVYTHPLWFLLLAAGVSLGLKAYYWSIILGIIFTSGLFYVVYRYLRDAGDYGLIAFISLAAFCASSFVFVQFQTSGLENSLTNFLICLAILAFSTGCPQRGWLVIGFLLANRLDQVFLIAPLALTALLTDCFDKRRLGSRVGSAVLGLLPLFIWEGISFIYYGFLFPNTAYAKLVQLTALQQRGLLYIFDYIKTEPTHVIVPLYIIYKSYIALNGESRLLMNNKSFVAAIAVLIGVVLQLTYSVAIGGDFMRGRFLASAIFALWVSCAYLFSLSLSKHAGQLKFASVVPVVFLLFALPYDFIKGFNAPEYVGVGEIKGRWIANEWRIYRDREWIANRIPRSWGDIFRTRDCTPIRMTFYVGNSASEECYSDHDTKFLMAHWAFISDPFTARIPYFDPLSNVGHVKKPIPLEYLHMEKAALEPRYSAIDQERLAQDYDLQKTMAWQDGYLEQLYFVMCAITREPLFSEIRINALRYYYSHRIREFFRVGTRRIEVRAQTVLVKDT